jgi:pimeloyl-ACP methyl ester carboxylesterase
MLLWILLPTLALYAIVLAAVALLQERLIFFPEVLPQSHRFEKPEVVERTIAVPGATLSALHFRQPDARGLLFFLHGNGGNADLWLPSTDVYRHVRFDVLMLDYRGYGKSTGRIQSEGQLHADVLAAYRSVASEYAGRPIVIYGRSLGSGLAAKLATEVVASLLVLVSPYTSLRALGRKYFPWVPPFVVRYPLPTEKWLPSVNAPVMLLHGDRDALISVAHAERLKELRPDAELVIVEGAAHDDIHTFDHYLETLTARLEALESSSLDGVGLGLAH